MAQAPFIVDTVPQHPVKSWTRGVPVESEAKLQLRNVADMPFIHHHVAVMPDVHLGKGATIGSVIPTKGAIIPAAVGVDLGCGMMAVRTQFTSAALPDNLDALRSGIEARIPHGRTDNGGPGDKGAWANGMTPDRQAVEAVAGVLNDPRLGRLISKYPGLFKWSDAGTYALAHAGTLGTGNHFVEACLDEEDRVWVMLHSGSRGIGNRLGSFFIERAKLDMKRWFINLPDKDLAYIPEGSEMFQDYVDAVNWAQGFASINRDIMMDAATEALEEFVGAPVYATDLSINCHHNYVAKENHFGANVWVTRKGAVRAREGDLGIIPGSMGARSFIVEGLGNAESFHSCSHGAGRAMSRSAARRKFTVEDHAAATAGVECRKDESVIDETPAAYKDIDAVMAAQADLVKIRHTLRQIVCVKG